MGENYFVFDFDSTIIKFEGLDELARIAFRNNKELLDEFEAITRQGMAGKLGFHESLSKRLKILKANKEHIKELIMLLKNNISESMKNNKEFFKENRDKIYIFSGGFKEFIIPTLEEFDIRPDHVFANNFIYDEKGNILWFNEDNIMCRSDAKIIKLKELNLGENVTVVGDGYTDYLMKEAGLAKTFIAYTENVRREEVAEKADMVAGSFDDIFNVALN